MNRRISATAAVAAALLIALVVVPSAWALRFTDDSSAAIAEPPGEPCAAILRFEEFERAEP
jgi:hypothetical protein